MLNHSYIIIFVLLLIVIFYIFIYKKSEKFNKDYYGYPLDSSHYINDSGADLRFATSFTSTDEGQ